MAKYLHCCFSSHHDFPVFLVAVSAMQQKAFQSNFLICITLKKIWICSDAIVLLREQHLAAAHNA